MASDLAKGYVARLMMDSALFIAAARFPGLQADRRHTGVLSLPKLRPLKW